jgi:hypothetical protein
VRLLREGNGSRCSAVAVGPRRALTAAHCILHPPLTIDGRAVTGRVTGHDRAELAGRFPPPYAPIGQIGGRGLVVEGYGCDPGQIAFVEVPELHARPVRLIAIDGPPGLEIILRGRVCHGDSGGAIWADGGGLVGILTASGTGVDRDIGYGTPAGQ